MIQIVPENVGVVSLTITWDVFELDAGHNDADQISV